MLLKGFLKNFGPFLGRANLSQFILWQPELYKKFSLKYGKILRVLVSGLEEAHLLIHSHLQEVIRNYSYPSIVVADGIS